MSRFFRVFFAALAVFLAGTILPVLAQCPMCRASLEGSPEAAAATNQMNTSSTIWHTTDHGASWQSQLTSASSVIAIWSTTSGDTFAVGTAILESTDHGATWPQVGTSPAVLQGVGGDPAGKDIYAVGFNGVILHRGL